MPYAVSSPATSTHMPLEIPWNVNSKGKVDFFEECLYLMYKLSERDLPEAAETQLRRCNRQAQARKTFPLPLVAYESMLQTARLANPNFGLAKNPIDARGGMTHSLHCNAKTIKRSLRMVPAIYPRVQLVTAKGGPYTFLVKSSQKRNGDVKHSALRAASAQDLGPDRQPRGRKINGIHDGEELPEVGEKENKHSIESDPAGVVGGDDSANDRAIVCL
jgi:hypothetical protein